MVLKIKLWLKCKYTLKVSIWTHHTFDVVSLALVCFTLHSFRFVVRKSTLQCVKLHDNFDVWEVLCAFTVKKGCALQLARCSRDDNDLDFFRFIIIMRLMAPTLVSKYDQWLQCIQTIENDWRDLHSILSLQWHVNARVHSEFDRHQK